MEPELIADYACVTGENPLWHGDEQRLYWLDIPTGRVFRWDPADGTHEVCHEGDVLGGFTLQADGSLLLFLAGGKVALLRDGQLTPIVAGIPAERDSRFNDVIADPAGRVFCGTMPSPDRPGRLYRLDRDGTLIVLLEDVECSNGLGFTPDGRGLYYTDSTRREISLFDYDAATGQIANRRLFVRTADDEGVPDGMTVDAEGYVWSARWDGGCVVRYAPDGTEDRRIDLPARKVSSVVFGGADYDELYLTTAGGDNKPAEGAGAGALFRIDPGVRGVAEFRSRIDV